MVKVDTGPLPADFGILKNDTPYVGLARKVIDYFHQYRSPLPVGLTTLDDWRQFVLSWSKPWRFQWLTSAYSNDPMQDAKLETIVKGKLTICGDSDIELEERKNESKRRMLLVKPPVDLSLYEGETAEGHFTTLSEIRHKAEHGKLKALHFSSIRIDPDLIAKFGHCVHPELAEILMMHFNQPHLPSYVSDNVMVSSGSRDLVTQGVLYDLGYPAARLSMHTKGCAVDLKLADSAKLFVRELFAEECGATSKFPGLTRAAAVDTLLADGGSIDIHTLVEHGVIPRTALLSQLDTAIRAIPSVQVLDETPFFRVFEPESNRTISLNAVWHVQLPRES